MRRMVPVVVALFAIPLFAAEDSPLVAAAKRTNRLGKTPANVITNETIAKSEGRLSVASGVTATPAPAPAATSAATPAQAAQKAAAAPAPRPATAAAPPPAQQGSSREDSSRVSTSTPQSTAVNVAPQSSAANIAPQSTVSISSARSTLGTSAPPSTAVTVPATTVQPTKID